MTRRPPTAAEGTRTVQAYYADLARENPGEDLAALAERFIRLKQDLGLRFRREGADLRDFVGFLGARGGGDLGGDALDAYTREIRGRRPATHRTALRVAGEFLDHLAALGRTSVGRIEVPPGPPRPDYRPYIFSVDELRFLFARADLPHPGQDRAAVYVLLYACGLRVGEAARLRVGDVDLDRGTIFLERTKFNKDRLLPLAARMRERLARYRQARRAGAEPQDPFFVDGEGRAYTATGLSGAFRRDLVAWGMDQPTRVAEGLRWGSPRVHALRHSFAIHRLLSWYRSGADVQAKLPLLSTYLGHSRVRDTQVYLKVAGLLLREGHRRFAGRWEKEFALEP
jgi:integrase